MQLPGQRLGPAGARALAVVLAGAPPLRELDLRDNALTAEALPTTHPTRHPVMLNALDSEKNSIAVSSAPSTCRMLGAL